VSDSSESIDLTHEGMVSIWVVPHITDDALAQAFESEEDGITPFGRAFGIAHLDFDFLEISFEKEPVEVAQLLEGVSYGVSFRASAIEQARSKQLNRANAVVLLYDVQFDPVKDSEDAGTFHFLGVFPYDPATEA
jgi:hypothetical protein